MNEEKITKTRQEIEGFTHVPDSLYETGLSMGAAGLLIAWLSCYQQGETPSLVQVAPKRDLVNPEFGEILRELMESGVMPVNYHDRAITFDREYLDRLGGL